MHGSKPVAALDSNPRQQATRVRSLIVWRKESDGRWRITQELMHEVPEEK